MSRAEMRGPDIARELASYASGPRSRRRLVVVLVVILAVLIAWMAIPSSGSVAVSRHDAKVRTFKALLRITEEQPDAISAAHAAITVDGCRKSPPGWLCHGSLFPVQVSDIAGNTCKYLVGVYPRHTVIHAGDC